MFRVILLITGMFVSLSSYSKCRVDFIETKKAFDHAKNVVWVYVRNAQHLDNSKIEFKAEFEVIELFKGDLNKDNLGTVFYSSSTTSFLLTPGKSYMLYLQGDNFASRCLGSKKYTWHMDKGKLQNKLKKLSEKAL